MFIEILLFFALGVLSGIATGIVPGLHPNSVMVIASATSMLGGYHPLCALSFIVSMAITNTIVNFIPSIFVGAPEAGTCLSVLPGHRFLSRGEGYDALFMTVTGGVVVMSLTILALPFLVWFIPFIYGVVHGYIHWLLLASVIVLLLQESGYVKVHALLFFFISGCAGFMLMSSLPSQQVLFPSLTGLFGMSVLVTGMAHSSTFPEQKMLKKKKHSFMKGSITGWIAGLFVGILPGIGSAQAGVLANTLLKGSDRDFLTALGGINTANVMFTFIALHTISKARSGASVFISDILGTVGAVELYFIASVAIFSCFVAAISTLWIGRRIMHVFAGLNYQRVNMSVIIIMAILVFAFSGIVGIVIMSICSLIGISCAYMGVKRMYLMGFLMLPTMLYFSGTSSFTLIMLGL